MIPTPIASGVPVRRPIDSPKSAYLTSAQALREPHGTTELTLRRPRRAERSREARPSAETRERPQMATVKGILGRKLGMTQVWDSENRIVPVTVIQAGPCRVVQLKTPERDGYSAVQLAFGATKESRLTKPELGHLKKAAASRRSSTSRSCGSTTSRAFEVGQVDQRRRVRRRRARRRHRHRQGQGLRRRDAAPQLQGPGRAPRQPQEAPRPGLDRRLRHARPASSRA